MTWNYRIIRDPITLEVGIHAVFYDEDGSPKDWTINTLALQANSLEELQEEFVKITRAFSEPVLEISLDEDKLVAS